MASDEHLVPPDDDDPGAAPGPRPWRDQVAELVDGLRTDRRVARVVVGVLLALGVALAGWVVLRPSPPPPVDATLPYAPGAGPEGAPAADGAAAAPTSVEVEPATIVVHAAGAVAVPGLHELPEGARVADLLAAAGGPATDADLDRLNLAAPLADGQRVWVLRAGQEAPPPVAGPDGAGGGGDEGGGGGAPAGPVDVNSASAEQLDTLPGVGPSTAAAIIAHRDEAGPFTSVDQLLDVPGIGEAKLEAMRDQVVV